MRDDADVLDAMLLRAGRLEELFARYRPILLARALNKRGLHRQEAEDVVQSAMLRVYREIAAGKRHPVPIRVVLHLVLDWSVGAHKQAAFRTPVPDEHIEAEGEADGDLDEVDTRDFLRSVLAVLPVGDRTVCYLHVVHDMRPAEIAERLGKTPNAVHQSLHRIRRRFRDACGT